MAGYGDLLLGGALAVAPPAVGGDDKKKRKRRQSYGDALLGIEQPKQPKPKSSAKPGALASAAQGFADMATFGFADEIEGGIRSAAQGIPYQQAVKIARQRQAESGPAYYAGMAAGALVPGLGVAGAATRGVGKAAQYGLGALAGAAEGGVQALGEAEGGLAERAKAVPAGAAIGAVGGAAGTAIGRGLTKYANRKAARDLGRLDRRQVDALKTKADELGIHLTPAELTGLPSLAQQQKQLGNTVGAGDDLADFYRRRANEQITPAVESYLGKISDFQGDEAAGESIRAAANQAMETVAEQRSKQASPLYKKAFAEAKPVAGVDAIVSEIDQSMTSLPKTGKIARRLRGIRRMLVDTVETIVGPDGTPIAIEVPENRLDVLHSVKLELDQMLERSPANSIGNTERREVAKVKSALIDAMDLASKDYQSARAIFADLSPGVERVREGVAGKIADLPDTQLRTVATRLFSDRRISPRSAREAKAQLQKADPQAWQAIKRSFIEDAWQKAGAETLGSQGAPVNQGAKFRKALMGSVRQRQILKEVMEPDEYQALTDLSSVLEAAGRVKPIGSDTAWNQMATRAAKQDAASPLSKAMRFISLDALKEASKAWDDARFARHSDELVKIITSPDGMKLLRQLREVTPNAQFQRAVIGQIVAQIGTNQAIDQ